MKDIMLRAWSKITLLTMLIPLIMAQPTGAVEAISFSTENINVQANQSFEMPLEVDYAYNLFSVNFNLNFDPSILKYDGVVPGSFLNQNCQAMAIGREVSAGLIAVSVGRAGSCGGAIGYGEAVILKFTALNKSGGTALAFADGKLGMVGDEGIDYVNGEWSDGLVNVTSTSTSDTSTTTVPSTSTSTPPVVSTPSSLTYDYWANQDDSINFYLGKIDLNVSSKPANPWEMSWGRNLTVAKDKVYSVKFNAYAENIDSQAAHPVTLRIIKASAPYTPVSQIETVNLTTANATYEFDLYAAYTEADADVSVWCGFETGKYHFSNISVTEKTPAQILETKPLDYSYWSNVPNAMNYAFGRVDFDFTVKPDAPWKTTWGRNVSVVKDKAYKVSFDGWMQAYGTETEAPVTMRLNQTFAPYATYSQIQTVKLTPAKQHFEVELYSAATDPNSVVGVWTGYQAGKFYFANIAVEEITPAQVISTNSLDYSWWSNVDGALNYAFGHVDIDVDAVPSEPWQRSWGKDLSVAKDKAYVVSFDAYAVNHANQAESPITVLINQNYAPYSRYSQIETLKFSGDKKHYEVELYSAATDEQAVIGIWTGYAAAKYHFENISITEKAPATILDVHPLDYSWWSNVAQAVNYAFGFINIDVDAKPQYPWDKVWGKDLAVADGKSYILSFDAYSEGAAADAQIPVSARLGQNYSPFYDYSKAKTARVNGNKAHYELTLDSFATDPNAVMSVWVGHEAGKFRFSNIAIQLAN